MKILRVISSMDPRQGGPCQGIRNSIPEMKKKGVENEVICLDSLDSEYLGKDSFIIHAIGPAKNPWGYNKQLITWLLSNLHRFDIVIIHGLWLYHGYATHKAIQKYYQKNKKRPKYYVMPHGMLDPYFQKASDRKIKAIRNIIYWKLIENKIINNADGVLFTCEEELRLARTTFIPYRPNMEVNVGYGIKKPPVYDENMRIDFQNKCMGWNKKPFILFLSRIHKKKGVDLLVNAYIKLQDEFKNLPQLVIAGPGLETSYGKEIQQLSSKNKNIVFTGMLNGDAKWGAFYNCECFILPSHQENFGIAIVEALACNKPVLITDKVNIWREIEKSKAGFVSGNTETEVYKLLKKWVDLTPDQKMIMEINALDTYEKYFSVEKATQKMIYVFEQNEVKSKIK